MAAGFLLEEKFELVRLWQLRKHCQTLNWVLEFLWNLAPLESKLL
jgi:hypothetical protein